MKKKTGTQGVLLLKDYEDIQHEFTVYLNRFIKTAKNGRIQKEPLFRESSLIIFVDQLI